MKKTFIFFAVFFLFSALSAEEIASENKESPEISENTDSCACNEYKKDNEILAKQISELVADNKKLAKRIDELEKQKKSFFSRIFG